MARVGTSNLNIGQFLDGENPGAGQQGVDNNGLNGNWIKIDTALGTQHNANGTHKDDVIDGNSIKRSATDGATLTTNNATGTKTLQVKDGGIGTTQLGAAAVTTAKMAGNAADSTIVASHASVDASRAIGTNHIKDANVTLAKLASLSVDASKVVQRSLTSVKLDYAEIVLFVGQGGTQIPTYTVVADNWINTQPTYSWSRTSAGVYILTSSLGIFRAGYTFVICPSSQNSSYGLSHCCAVVTGTNTISVKTFRGDTGALSDNAMENQYIIIRVYP